MHTRKKGGILDTVPPTVTVQIQPSPSPAIPTWMGEVAACAHVLTHTGMFKTIQEQVRFARARFGQYVLIDFVAVLIGYVLSGEPTLLAFYERLTPWADAFMALFGRDRLPHRSTLSRFLAALDQNTVEALRTCFQEDVLARTPFPSAFRPVRSDRCAVASHGCGWNEGIRLVNEQCRKRTRCLLPIAGSRLCARQAIKAASEEKWSVPER